MKNGNVRTKEELLQEIAGLHQRVKDLEEASLGNYDQVLGIDNKLVGNSFLETLLRHSPIGIAFLDRDLRYMLVNDKLGETSGISPSEHIGKRVEEILPTLAVQAQNVVSRILETGKPLENFEVSGEIPSNSGKTIYWTESWYPVHDASREIVGFWVLMSETTKQKKTQHRAELLASFPLLNPSPVLEINLFGQVIFANPAAEKVLVGLGLNKDDQTRFLPEDIIDLINNWDRKTQITFDREVTVEDTIFAERITLSPEFQVARIYAVDVTQRKRVEEELRESEKRYRIMGETVPYGVWLCGPDGGARYFSQSFLDLLEMTQGEQQEFGWTHRLPPEDVEPMMKKWLQCIETGEPWDSELRVLGPDGKYHTVLTRGLPVRNENGEITRWVGINLDIDERKRLEQELLKSRDELEFRVQERTEELQAITAELLKEAQERQKVEEQLRQAHKMEAIGTLAGGIAHDFNNILAAIIGFTEISVEDVSDNPIVENNLRNVIKSATRAKELVKKILAFSRKTGHKRSPVSLSPIFEESVQLLRASIPANVELKLSLRATTDIVVAAPVEIQQIIMNLTTNAYLAMPDQGGTVEIVLADIDFDPGPSMFDETSREYVQIIVKDTGAGMTPDVMRRIFEPFYTTREPGVGTGMGLAVVYGIVKDLRGAITVESEPGSGSTFRVLIPKGIPTASEPETQETQSVGGKERILFVDDEVFLTELGTATLEKLGYSVTGVMDSREALRIFSENPSGFDLVITDQAMPSMTGNRLVEELFKIRADIPIILCTGHSATVSAEMAKEMGIKAYLLKPVGMREMARTVRTVLDNP